MVLPRPLAMARSRTPAAFCVAHQFVIRSGLKKRAAVVCGSYVYESAWCFFASSVDVARSIIRQA